MREKDIEKEIIRIIDFLEELSKVPRHKGKGKVENFYEEYLDTLMREYARTGEN